MRIYYDEVSKNIVLGATTRLFATESLVASADRGRVSVVYRANNFRELFIRHTQVLREDGSPAGSTLTAVIDYLNTEFNKSPFVEGGGSAAVPIYVQPNEVYTVSTDTQALFRKRIKIGDGARIKLKGILVGV